ncbi:hypothetical protein COCOBI_06-0260 [Coccomyxa sp. Obi]|nr:hypothetical protein COCOBI_06-0260 [Coccomyxa sp. Obi]
MQLHSGAAFVATEREVAKANILWFRRFGRAIMQRKRSADDLETPVGLSTGLTSKRGRVVKPKQWDDGTEAPIALGGSRLARRTPPPKEDSGPSSGSDRPRRPASAGASLGRDTAKKATVPLRDETGRFAGVRPKTAAERSQSGTPSQGGIFKSAAEKVLAKHSRLMSTGEIARYAIKYALISPQGKTPEATMASALYTDIKKKEGASIFIRPHEGLFGLREWLARDMNLEGTNAALDHSGDQLRLPRGNGSARYRHEASVGVGEYAGDYESDEHVAASTDGGGLRAGPYLPPRKRRVPSANGSMRGGLGALPGWGRTGLSRAASTGAVEDIAVARPDFGAAARSKSMNKDMGAMEALMEAVGMETKRSNSVAGDEDDDEMEPSTAGSPLGKDVQRDDARSRRGLRAAPPKSRKLQPPSPEHSGRRESAAPIRRKRSSYVSVQNGGSNSHPRHAALLDDDALGRSPRSVAAKARYANPSAQAIASQCEEEGMEVEGFNAVRLKAIQAKLAAEGGNPPNRNIKQDNILNLPLPEFDLEATEDGEEEEDVLAPDEAPAQDAVINPPAQAPVGPAASGGTNSEDGSAAPAAPPAPEPGPPTPALLHKMEMALRGLENQRGHNHPSVGHACIELSKAYLAAHQGEQAAKHLNRAVTILTLNARGNSLSKEGQEHVNYLLGRVADMTSEAAQNSSAPAQPPAQPPAGEPAPTPIPTPKMLNPPPYILPGAAPNQAVPFQAPPNPAVPNQAVPIQAVPNQAAPASSAAAQMGPKQVVAATGIPNAPTGLGVGLARPTPASTIQQGPLAPSAPAASVPLADGVPPPTSAAALIQTSA